MAIEESQTCPRPEDKACVPGIRSNEKGVPGAFPREPRKGRDTKSKSRSNARKVDGIRLTVVSCNELPRRKRSEYQEAFQVSGPRGGKIKPERLKMKRSSSRLKRRTLIHNLTSKSGKLPLTALMHLQFGILEPLCRRLI